MAYPAFKMYFYKMHKAYFYIAFWFSFGFLPLTGAFAQESAAAKVAEKETLLLKETSFDFGKIQQGRPVTHLFQVSNNGKEALRLENVQASCGCTTPEWSYAPVQPGESTTIKVGYNAAAEGSFQKTVTIFYNGNQNKVITISGLVYKAPATSVPANTSLAIFKQTQISN